VELISQPSKQSSGPVEKPVADSNSNLCANAIVSSVGRRSRALPMRGERREREREREREENAKRAAERSAVYIRHQWRDTGGMSIGSRRANHGTRRHSWWGAGAA